MGIRWSLIIRWQCEEQISPSLIWSNPQTREYIDWQCPLSWHTPPFHSIWPLDSCCALSTPPQHNVIFSRGFWRSVRISTLVFPFYKILFMNRLESFHFAGRLESFHFVDRLESFHFVDKVLFQISRSLFEFLNTKVLGHSSETGVSSDGSYLSRRSELFLFPHHTAKTSFLWSATSVFVSLHFS